MPGAPGLRAWGIGLLCAVGALLTASPSADAAVCPTIQNKPNAIPHVDYQGVQHLSYCYGPVSVKSGQNIIRLNPTKLFPQKPGYITRFDPELVYLDGSVPRVDVLHLHHAVWIVNGNPQFATGEEKSIMQMPKGFGWRTTPSDHWFVNDMIHDLVGKRRHRLHRVEDGLRARHVSGRRLDAPRAHQVDGRVRAQPAGRDLEPDLSRLQRSARNGQRRPLLVPRPGHRRAAQPRSAPTRSGRPTTR